jgi:hypothetical protein
MLLPRKIFGFDRSQIKIYPKMALAPIIEIAEVMISEHERSENAWKNPGDDPIRPHFASLNALLKNTARSNANAS